MAHHVDPKRRTPPEPVALFFAGEASLAGRYVALILHLVLHYRLLVLRTYAGGAVFEPLQRHVGDARTAVVVEQVAVVDRHLPGVEIVRGERLEELVPHRRW